MNICKGINKNGKQCSHKPLLNNEYCKKHLKVEHSTIGTNTEDQMYNDLILANKVILELLDDRVEHETVMSELLELYKIIEYVTDV